MTDEQAATNPPRGPSSFCITRAAFDALLAAKANAYEICAYLVLARHTEESGCYSTASISAVNRRTGMNKVKGGPADRAIKRLLTIQAPLTTRVSNCRSGKYHQWIERKELCPILIDRDTWLAEAEPGKSLPDGPTEHSKVRYVLPDFGEPIDERVWFGGNLVTGVHHFDQPLKALKNAGDVAAQLLLALYAANDMETWGGVRPVDRGYGPWKSYEPVSEDVALFGGARLIRAKEGTVIANRHQMAAIVGTDDHLYWQAIEALQSAGLLYEMVLVLNRSAIKGKLSNGSEYSGIPTDAEPFYELDCRSRHGYKPKDEEGIGGTTARTAGELGYPVTDGGISRDKEDAWDKADGTWIPPSPSEAAVFDGTYAAIVPAGYPAMLAGIFRLRFRISNTRNAGVKGTWAGIIQRNHEAFEFVQRIRAANNLSPSNAPWDVARAARDAAAATATAAATEVASPS